MPYDLPRNHRRSIRLRGYDYAAPGGYFLTLVTQRRACLFGEIVRGEMRLNAFGEIARAEWMKTAVIRPEIALDEFVIMPDHIHAIIIINHSGNGLVGAQRRCAPTGKRTPQQKRNVEPGSIGAIIRAYKSAVTNRINQSRGTPGAPIWQRNYYEHIIRNDGELTRIRQYIRNNLVQWETDVENRCIDN